MSGSNAPSRALPLLVPVVLLLAACASTEPVRGSQPDSLFPPSTQVGDRLHDGRLMVEEVGIPRGKGDEARFRIRNTGDRDLTSLTATVLFYFDAPRGGLAKLASHGDAQIVDFPAGSVIELRALYRSLAYLRSLVLRVGMEPTVPGVKYLGGALECRDVTSDPGTISFRVKNVGPSPIPGVEYRVVLVARAGDEVIMQSDWETLGGGTVRPGEEITLVPRFPEELRGFPNAILQIRRKR